MIHTRVVRGYCQALAWLMGYGLLVISHTLHCKHASHLGMHFVYTTYVSFIDPRAAVLATLAVTLLYTSVSKMPLSQRLQRKAKNRSLRKWSQKGRVLSQDRLLTRSTPTRSTFRVINSKSYAGLSNKCVYQKFTKVLSLKSSVQLGYILHSKFFQIMHSSFYWIEHASPLLRKLHSSSFNMERLP